jgi:hypothetical protein
VWSSVAEVRLLDDFLVQMALPPPSASVFGLTTAMWSTETRRDGAEQRPSKFGSEKPMGKAELKTSIGHAIKPQGSGGCCQVQSRIDAVNEVGLQQEAIGNCEGEVEWNCDDIHGSLKETSPFGESS